jgi:anti-anti-sigma regulatory factor
MREPARQPVSMRATAVDDHVTITLDGSLDADAGNQLVDAVMSTLLGSTTRIDIDLSVLTSFTSNGAMALARCRELCAHLAHGLHYRTEGGAGQLALLSAFEREPEVDSLT